MRPSRLRMWPPLPPDVYLRRPTPDPPYPLGAPDCLLLRKARQALFFGIQALELRPGDEVLLPAYHHGSEVEAFLRRGLTCRFYDIDPTLRPNAQAIEQLLGPRTRALYLIHYLGFPQDAPGWLQWCRERGLLLIEDAAQAWLASVGGRPLAHSGTWPSSPTRRSASRKGDAAQQSTGERRGPRPPRRDRQSPAPAGQPPPSLADLQVVDGGQPAGRVHAPVEVVGLDLGARQDPCSTIPGDRVPPAPGCWSPTRLSGADATTKSCWTSWPGRTRRADGPARRGGAVLLPDPDHRQARADRAARRARDRRRGLLGVAHPSLPAAAFPMANRLRASIVGVPVHQELRGRNLERLVAVVRRWGGRNPDSPTSTRSRVPPRRGVTDDARLSRRWPHGTLTADRFLRGRGALGSRRASCPRLRCQDRITGQGSSALQMPWLAPRA